MLGQRDGGMEEVWASEFSFGFKDRMVEGILCGFMGGFVLF